MTPVSQNFSRVTQTFTCIMKPSDMWQCMKTLALLLTSSPLLFWFWLMKSKLASEVPKCHVCVAFRTEGDSPVSFTNCAQVMDFICQNKSLTKTTHYQLSLEVNAPLKCSNS